jgi:hypothetical protein
MAWYDAENYADMLAIAGAVAFGLLLLYPDKRYLQAAAALAVGVGIGAHIGIEATAKGRFGLPLWMMQKQLIEEWGFASPYA